MQNEKRTEVEDRDSDLDLIRRMASKDAHALDAFYERYKGVAFGLVFRIVGNREDAEDVLVDVFWQTWLQAARYDKSRGKPIAWLLTIARTRAIDSVRASGRRGDSVETVPETQASAREPDLFVQADMRAAVREAVGALPDQQRTPLEMAFFQGMSHTEIATALDQPLGTIKDRIRNGMMHLRKRLKSYL